MGKRRATRGETRRLAAARIQTLWEQASQAAKTDPDGARRRMLIAGRVAQKARMKMPRHIKRRVCRGCGNVLVPGENCRVRVRQNRSKHLSVTCLDCGSITRFYVG
ncbi:MAG: ribonuclease P protein component 4 [Candidatus Thorarchaeota archaeon]